MKQEAIQFSTFVINNKTKFNTDETFMYQYMAVDDIKNELLNNIVIIVELD